jgi:hypothetical protein
LRSPLHLFAVLVAALFCFRLLSGRPALSLSIHSVYMLANILDIIYEN